MLCWAIIPFFLSYVDTGEFTFKGKFMRAIYENVIFYAIALIAGAVFLAYLWT